MLLLVVFGAVFIMVVVVAAAVGAVAATVLHVLVVGVGFDVDGSTLSRFLYPTTSSVPQGPY